MLCNNLHLLIVLDVYVRMLNASLIPAFCGLVFRHPSVTFEWQQSIDLS